MLEPMGDPRTLRPTEAGIHWAPFLPESAGLAYPIWAPIAAFD
jgi:hypothetical protein